MNKVLISLSVIGAIVVFILGGGVGVLYQNQQVAPSQKNQTMEATIKTLSSKAVPSIVAFGQATKIDGKNITLSLNGDSITISVNDDAQIYSLAQQVATGTGAPIPQTQQKVEFKDIKTGDNLNISLKVLSDGQLKGERILIFPSSGTPINPK